MPPATKPEAPRTAEAAPAIFLCLDMAIEDAVGKVVPRDTRSRKKQGSRSQSEAPVSRDPPTRSEKSTSPAEPKTRTRSGFIILLDTTAPTKNVRRNEV